MKLTRTRVLNAPREKVYAALLDPDILKACIEGCESLTPSGPDGYDAVLRVGIAGMKGAYTGRVDLLDRVPPASLTLRIEGKGFAGSVRSTSRVTLYEKDGGTELVGEGEVEVGGLISLAGPRVVAAAAEQLLSDFFEKLAARL